MQYLSVLVIDDEPESRDLLTLLLSEIDGVRVVGEADSVESALNKCLLFKPDLLFLDIQMPSGSGFDLIGKLRSENLNPGYIFVTAHEQYAIRAIRESAFDYLVKPVGSDELTEAINRYRFHRYKNNYNDKIEKLLTRFDTGLKIKIHTRTGYILIQPNEIYYVLADGNYSDIFFRDGRKETVTYNLSKIMMLLPSDSFFRISRSSIINLKYLIQVDKKDGACRISSDNIVTLKVSRSRFADLDRIWDSKI